MTRPFCRVAVVLMVGLLSSVVSAQDLVALAKKEKARRAKIANPGKVLTEEDGKEAAAKGVGSVTALTGENASPAAEVERQPTENSIDPQKAAWKARSDSARAAVVDAQKKLEEMERDLAALRSDLTPLSADDAQDPMRLQKREARIVEMNKQIQAQKAAIVEARRALSAFEDEARKNAVPAGWLR